MNPEVQQPQADIELMKKLDAELKSEQKIAEEARADDKMRIVRSAAIGGGVSLVIFSLGFLATNEKVHAEFWKMILRCCSNAGVTGASVLGIAGCVVAMQGVFRPRGGASASADRRLEDSSSANFSSSISPEL